jgi:hypothetical protein
MLGCSVLHVNTLLKPLRHAINALIYKVLADPGPSLYGYISGFRLIPMWKLLEVLLYTLLTILYRSKI